MNNTVDIGCRSNIESQICGAINSAVDAHGPITRANSSSTAKRIYGVLKGIARSQRKSSHEIPTVSGSVHCGSAEDSGDQR